jgi:hypothetical protein
MTFSLIRIKDFCTANAAIFLVIGILILIVILDSPILFGNKGGGSDSSTTSPSATATSSEEFWERQRQSEEQRKQWAEEKHKQEVEEKQRKVSELGKTFCQVRSKPYTRYVNLDDLILWFEKAGETVNLRPVMNKPPVKAKCDEVMKLCLGNWSEEDCSGIAEQKIWIGMDEDQLILSYGLPNERNRTVGSWGIHSQWVYGNFGPYVYLEGKDNNDLKVTSWQD